MSVIADKSLFGRTLDEIEYKRQRIIDGFSNCIPWGLPRFEQIVPGIEQKNFYLVSANSKVGKSQLTDFLFMYNPYNFYKANKSTLKLKIKYFSLEMSLKQKTQQNIVNRLFQEKGVRIDTRQLRSAKTALSQEIIDIIKTYKDYYEEYQDIVTFIDDIKTPYGIYSYMKEYALANGHWVMKTIDIKGKATPVRDYYVANNPDEYVIVIIDHASLVRPKKGSNLYQAINDLSSIYLLELRNYYNYIPVLVQQQASAQEGIENFKLDKISPTFAGLADNRNTQRDIDLGIGIYSPARYKIPSYLGYDTAYLNDNVRFMEIMGAREGGGGSVIPLFFDGAVTDFRELPHPNDPEMQAVYNKIGELRGETPKRF